MRLQTELPRLAMAILPILLAPAMGRAEEVVDGLFRLVTVSGAVDGGLCKPGATFRVRSEWQNVSGKFVRNVEARKAVLTGNNSLKSTHLLIPSRGSVAPQESVFGTFLIQLGTCASFQFYVSLVGSADQAILLWVNEFGEAASEIMHPGTAGTIGFTGGPGEPGGPGGFGGPPAGSGFPLLSDPVRIENLRVSDEGNQVRGVITLDLVSNVSSWRSSESLTETSPGANVFSNATDTLAIQVLRYSSHLPGVVNTLRASLASVAFGYRNTLELKETSAGSNLFASDHYQLVVTALRLPSPSVIDTLTLVRLSNWDQTLAAGVVLTETGADTLEFRSGAIVLGLTRLTGKENMAIDDFTADVSLNGAPPIEIDALETAPASLEFRTDAILNAGEPGVFPGATQALKVGEKWNPVLYTPVKVGEGNPPLNASVVLSGVGGILGFSRRFIDLERAQEGETHGPSQWNSRRPGLSSIRPPSQEGPSGIRSLEFPSRDIQGLPIYRSAEANRSWRD